MPLVGGDLCPIAIDEVQKSEDDEYDSPLHYIDHKEQGFEEEADEDHENEMFETATDEDHPIIEKGEHNDEEHSLGDERFIPEKGEHHIKE